MEMRSVVLIGAGAVGSYIVWGLEKRPDVSFCVAAEGPRAERLKKDGLVINGKTYFPAVKTPEEIESPDLVVVAVKGSALPGVLPMLPKIVGENTTVMSLMNGVTSERDIAAVIPAERILYAMIRISSERKGSSVFFRPEVTQGIFCGEIGTPDVTPRMEALVRLFEGTGVGINLCPDIQRHIWFKFALNVSRNLPQAILGVGAGSYFDSEHMDHLRRVLCEEVTAVAAAEGVDITDPEGAHTNYREPRLGARYSTLQDLDAGRHTEIDAFAGTMIELGRRHGIAVPYSEFCYHAIKALEEKNDGAFDY